MTAYEDHLRRLTDDAAYRAGFEEGLAGKEADSDEHDPSDPTSWRDGWRNGIAAHRMNTLTPDLTKAIAEAIEANATDHAD